MRRTCIVLVLIGFLHPALAEEEAPWSEQPFLGLSVRDTPAGPVVGWVRPGPLGGRGFESTSGVRRGDNLVSDPTVISVGSRQDAIFGQAGNDRLFGQEKDDVLWGADDALGV